MSDKQTLVEMLDRAGIKYEWTEPPKWVEAHSYLTITAEDDSKKNLGYWRFFAAFAFKEDESLDTVGIWEE